MPNPLAALFLPRRRLAAADPLVLQRGGPFGGSQWVAPRGECQYRRHDFRGIPQRQRAAAAALHVKRYLPSTDAVARIGWQGDVAHFWIWEKPLPAVQKGRARWMPESALRAPAIPDGLHLMRCIAGVEGQVWKGGKLLASQWWPEAPGLEAWQRFLRGAGLPLDQASGKPSVQERPLAVYPWALMQAERSGRFAEAEFVIWVATLSLLAAAAGWQSASLQQWSGRRESQAVELETLRASSSTILAGREAADAATAELARLQKLQNGLSDYVLVADIIGPLPSGSQVMRYLREGGKVTALVKTEQKDLRRLVAFYQAHPVLKEASAASAAEFVELTFDLPKPPDDEADATGTIGAEAVR